MKFKNQEFQSHYDMYRRNNNPNWIEFIMFISFVLICVTAAIV